MKSSQLRFILQASIAAFGAYFCMYAFRKPFTAASFEGISYWNVDYKILLLLAQVAGYALSKFLGIRIVSGLERRERLRLLIGLILLSEVALLLFALIPPPWNIAMMFLNGIPLGMIWGIVFAYLEGRKSTEFLGVALCSSFIISSGFMKSLGVYMIVSLGISEFWMPVIVGAIFILPIFLFAALLERIPAPDEADIQQRCERVPMDASSRKEVIRLYWVPILTTVLFYMSLTALRDLRDSFAREIWSELGFGNMYSIYTIAEIPIAIGVLLLLGFMGFIRSNTKAFISYHQVLLFGAAIVGISTLGFSTGHLAPVYWMVLTGFGLYICYVPFNAIFYDRMIAAYSIRGNAGFLIYIADAIGYLASVMTMLIKNFGSPSESWLDFFIRGAFLVSVSGILLVAFSWIYFVRYRIITKRKMVYTSEIYEEKGI